jgi:hypothetical protein
MNKHEIDEMMKDLPSQQPPEETLIQKVTIGIMLVLVLILMMWVPDFDLTEQECAQQTARAYTGNLCERVTKP